MTFARIEFFIKKAARQRLSFLCQCQKESDHVLSMHRRYAQLINRFTNRIYENAPQHRIIRKQECRIEFKWPDFPKEIGGSNGISPAIVADALLPELKSDTYEIYVGNTANLSKLFLSSAAEALLAINDRR